MPKDNEFRVDGHNICTVPVDEKLGVGRARGGLTNTDDEYATNAVVAKNPYPATPPVEAETSANHPVPVDVAP